MIVQLLHIWMCWLELDRMVLVQVYVIKLMISVSRESCKTFPGNNVPIKMGYNVFSSQLLRFSRICSVKDDFVERDESFFPSC